MSTPEADLANRFWDLANSVAGFSSLQMVAFLLAYLGLSGTRRRRLRDMRFRIIIIVVLFNVVVFGGAVWSCYGIEKSLRPAVQHSLVLWAAILRTAWIGAFTLLGCVATSWDIVE